MKKSFSKNHPGQSKIHSLIIILLGSIVTRFFYQIKLIGAENVPTEGALLVLSKHQSLLDIPLGTYALYKKSKRHAWAIMKDSLAKPFFRNFFQKCGGIPINRTNPEKSKSQFQMAIDVLQAGEIITIFPEQTLYRGKMGRGKPGAFQLLAKSYQSPLAVQCVGFHYTKSWLRNTVEIRIGTPTILKPQDDLKEFFEKRMREIAELSQLPYQ